jgi:tetrapyrrole methylase family protein/MazG family protein
MSERFDHLVRLMARLRAPDGCPWDRKQTHESLKPYLVEEAYEVLETIDRRDPAHLREELGDLLLQILFHAQIGAEEGTFTIDAVMHSLAEKLTRRHPHVFGPAREPGAPTNPDQVVSRWEQIKREERKQAGRSAPDQARSQPAASSLDGVPKTLPALLRAYQLQARASRVGFDWPHTGEGVERIIKKIGEEVQELREVLQTRPSDPAQDHARHHIEAEFGDILFALVNLARVLKANPEEALRKATNRFADRFRYIETGAARSGRDLEDMTLTEMDALWEEAKQKETPDPAGSTGSDNAV